ncbi:hypothetical protein ASPVEDRAFT_29987 [Aspergillus versicolor CBS 583.65]|uniref:Uncharacterized protein n=1 Tax=Aspergillus versicolor CBS 583.65 TaxID=1036611 RepID=A0A1L9PPM8_ASPVE|nr:uncharacterized protein ASPVEDRAFT_29987 [Aspergillus versicolor CBS 583.65]OJJ03470.1 hypothetical protein ASPVEDRAFT_29987 [Aspergillus versicolor CBS 583.65]
MPPQRSSRKLTRQAQHALIRKYNISIEGPVRRRDWPPRYAPIFGLVRDMEKVQYEEYSTRDYGSDDVRRILVSKMCNRVEKLVIQAHALRESLDNEETWRLKTENLIIERFEEDVDCHVCADRRWISDFQAIPSCPDTAARLTGIRGDRKLCQCSEATRAKLLAEASSQNTFITKGSCTVVDRSMAEIQKKMLAHHRPDRVLGLGRTPELEHLLAANPSIPRTVIGEDMGMYFPFLVLEAKSEKNSVGFESIERQTVFPIRAMLDLQRNLEAASNVQFDPLVWFLANRGDEWRVYACVPHRAHTNIIDLWHGSILRHDSALQLLLVIDLLCDWARDIFMERITMILQEQAGLDGPNLLSQDSVQVMPPIQPSLGSPPALLPETTEPVSSAETMHFSSTTPAIVAKPETEDVVIDDVPDISTQDTPITEATMEPTPISITERTDRTIIPDGWPGHLALRSQFDVHLRFRSLSLPESAHDLSVLLATIDGKDKIAQTGIKLLESFSLISPLWMDQTCLGDPEAPLRPESQPLLYACLHWRTTIDYDNWVIKNELAWITASDVAMGVLAYISHIPGVKPSGGGDIQGMRTASDSGPSSPPAARTSASSGQEGVSALE